MGHWLDALAKASAGHRDDHRTPSPISETNAPPGPGRPSTDAVAPKAQGLTRRTLLRRGAVVGTVLWTTPVLQTAFAPAASASHGLHCSQTTCGLTLPLSVGTCPLCATGLTCTTGTECVTGLCTGGICTAIPSGSTCTTDGQCASGYCSPAGVCKSWPGLTCTADSQCQSGKCVGGRCFENGLNGVCRTTADCTDNTSCSATPPARGVCGGVGAPCANNNKCVSGKCQGGICQQP